MFICEDIQITGIAQLVELRSPKPSVWVRVLLPVQKYIQMEQNNSGMVAYLKESYEELIHKVTWPTWTMLFESTKVVLIASIIIALMIFAMDFISKTVTTFIYEL